MFMSVVRSSLPLNSQNSLKFPTHTDTCTSDQAQLCVFLQAAVKSRLPQGMDMNVNVLTSGYWPTYPVYDATLPEELVTYQQVFKVILRHSVCRAAIDTVS